MTTPTKTYVVAALENGTVIDHLPAGSALRIIELLNLTEYQHLLTVGIHLPSESGGTKDLIKVSDWEVPSNKTDQMAILAPTATVNIIRNYEVHEKFQVELPNTIEEIVSCPNPKCISNSDHVKSCFSVQKRPQMISLACRYCRKQFQLR